MTRFPARWEQGILHETKDQDPMMLLSAWVRIKEAEGGIANLGRDGGLVSKTPQQIGNQCDLLKPYRKTSARPDLIATNVSPDI